jgi:aldehyde dehydrogenase (NAD+)
MSGDQLELQHMDNRERLRAVIKALGLPSGIFTQGDLEIYSPIDGAVLGKVRTDSTNQIAGKIQTAHAAFRAWRRVPAPRRGELIRLFGDELRQHKAALGALVTLESGKIYQEGMGEVQEMIDICDFAVGLSRQLYGLTIPSERPGHSMAEYWHPAGVVGVISAFNFPVAVWAWNAALAFVCGDTVVWKPSEKTPLTALACAALFDKAITRLGTVPEGLLHIIIGAMEAGGQLAEHNLIPVISATGSVRMGKSVAPKVAARLGRAILELGGNNCMIVAPTADLDLAARAILFGAVGTAGQRCTSLRRLIVHNSVYKELMTRLYHAYDQIQVGDPFEPATLCGPLIDKQAYENMQHVIAQLTATGHQVSGGERVLHSAASRAYYVKPAIVETTHENELLQTETFAPLLYVMRYELLDDALTWHNDVPQGLSSCIFTESLYEAQTFLSAWGSDCGIANVNIGTSGAEIGGAFGGEKETGGGRESGSDAWKAYMRRCTATINYSGELPLSQGIEFGID